MTEGDGVYGQISIMENRCIINANTTVLNINDLLQLVNHHKLT